MASLVPLFVKLIHQNIECIAAERKTFMYVSRKLTCSLGCPLVQGQHKPKSFPKVQNVNVGVRIKAGCVKIADVPFLTPRAKSRIPHALKRVCIIIGYFWD